MLKEGTHVYRPALLQAQHWTAAARRLSDLEALASDAAWESLEHYLRFELREKLQKSINFLIQSGEQLVACLSNRQSTDLATETAVSRLRSQYLKVETMVDFFSDALCTRTNPQMIALMRACDHMAVTAMKAVLVPLGYTVPPVLVYIDKGMGASILKAGLRLWDGFTTNPVAAIKVTRHNLLRPTALIHEAGHQVAHIIGWNEFLGEALHNQLQRYGAAQAEMWSSWSSEIAADVFAFVHTGFASVAALHDVVDGATASVFRYLPQDPHPICFLRVLLGIECCRQSFGEGPWESMRINWMQKHPVERASGDLQSLLHTAIAALPTVAEVILKGRFACFKSQALTHWVDPAQVHPARLKQEAQAGGKSFFQSHYLLAQQPLQKLAWNGYQLATVPEQGAELLRQQQDWMCQLGKSILS